MYDVAHGVLAYEERAVVVVGCEESCEKAPTKEEALEFEHKALELRRLIDIDIHHDRMRHTVGEEIANFINGYLEDSTVSPHTSSEQPVFRHGFGLYEGVAAEVDPQGHGVIRTVGLQVGEGVLAAKRQQVGSHEAMKQLAVFRAQATAVSSSTGHKSSHKEKPQVRQPDFTWAFPEPVSESIARGVVELGVPPIRDSLLTPGRIVGVGAGGRQHTFAVEYEDGDIEVSTFYSSTPCYQFTFSFFFFYAECCSSVAYCERTRSQSREWHLATSLLLHGENDLNAPVSWQHQKTSITIFLSLSYI